MTHSRDLTAKSTLNQPKAWIGVQGYSRLAAVSLQCGFNLDKLLKQAGIELDISQSTGHSFAIENLLTLFDLATKDSVRGYFPFELPKYFSFDSMPEIEAFISTSANLTAASRVLEWLPAVLVDDFKFSLGQAHQRIYLYFDCGAPCGTAGVREITETVIRCAELFITRLVPELTDVQVQFQHEPNQVPRVYDTYFLQRPVFGQSVNSLSIPFSALSRQILAGNPRINAMAALAIENSMILRSKERSLADAVADTIRENPEIGLEDSAAKLRMLPRTLQRRLKQEASSFQQIQDQELKEIACGFLLNPELDIESIAGKVGFSDRRSFTRAFKRWTSLSPKAWRDQNYK